MTFEVAQSGYLGGIEDARLEELERAGLEEKRRAVDQLVSKASTTASLAALQPLPLLDVAVLTPLQLRMVQSIARIYGHRLDEKATKRMFRAVWRPILACQTTIAAAKLIRIGSWVPQAPEAIAVSLAYALTHAIGRVSDEDLSRPCLSGASEEQLRSRVVVVSKETFAEALRTKRDEMRALLGDSTTRSRFLELKKARLAGAIDEAEARRRMAEILAGPRH